MQVVASHHDDAEFSEHAKNGKSGDRIRDILRRPKCKCRCVVNFRILMKICCVFWSLSKSGQDTVLWTIQQGSGGKRQWHIEGLLLGLLWSQQIVKSAHFSVHQNSKWPVTARTSCLQGGLDGYARSWTEEAATMSQNIWGERFPDLRQSLCLVWKSCSHVKQFCTLAFKHRVGMQERTVRKTCHHEREC